LRRVHSVVMVKNCQKSAWIKPNFKDFLHYRITWDSQHRWTCFSF
jgi:hypothetical protein